MVTNLEVLDVPGSVDGTGYYSKADLHVLFEIVPKQKTSFVYHIDTLTICLDCNMNLISLDAYTYHERWRKTSLEAPEPHFQGNVRVVANYDENGIASSDGHVRLVYTYDAERGVLRIGVGQDGSVPKVIVQVGDNLLVEIGSNHDLVNLWILNLHIQ